MSEIKYLISDPPHFRGFCEDILVPHTPKLMYSWLTPEQYVEKHGYPCRLVSQQGLEQAIKDYEESLITTPRPVNLADFEDARDSLPPCRWEYLRGLEVFHTSEPYYGNIVRWYARIGETCWTFLDRSNARKGHLVRKITSAI